MHCDVHYWPAKFEIKIQFVYGETKKINRVMGRVYKTGGNRSGLTGYRSNRSGPVPVWAGIKPAQIQNLNLNSKKWKIPKKFLKILQGATNLIVSNFLKNSFV